MKDKFTIWLKGDNLEKFYKILNFYSSETHPTFVSIFNQLIKDGYDKAFPSNKIDVFIEEKRGRKPSVLTESVKNLKVHASLFIPKEDVPTNNINFLVGAMIRQGKRISYRTTAAGWRVTRKK